MTQFTVIRRYTAQMRAACGRAVPSTMVGMLMVMLMASCSSAGESAQMEAIPMMPAPAEAAPSQMPKTLSGRSNLNQQIIHDGDILHMAVYGHEDLQSKLEVTSEGLVDVPLIGELEAAGKTVSNFREEIAAVLDKEYIVDPKVTLDIIGYSPIFILGQVTNPGSYDFQPGLTVRKAVALSGGFTPRASHGKIKIVRRAEHGVTEHGVKEFKGGIDTTVMPGDTVEIGRRWF